jgi:hypothetical protein
MTMGGHLTTGRRMRDDDDSDRLLVRPYVQPGAEAKVSSIHTEEEPVPDAARGEQRSTAVLPKTVEPPAELTDGRDRRVVLWLVGAGLALIVAVAVAIIGLWPHGDDAPEAVAPGTTMFPDGGAASPSAGASVSPSAKASASRSPSAARTTPPAGAPAAGSAPGVPPVSPSPSATLAPPPASDQVGPITGAGGLCLDIRGGIALPGGAVSAYPCNGTPSQRWTVAADGTLRAAGSCAAPDGSNVHLTGCDESGQWRAGPGGTLVNVGTGRCLTDPDNGAQTGRRMTLAACGGSGQRWVLP